MARREPGRSIESLALTSISGRQVAVPDPAYRLTHLQFRRFAGCPVCNFHLLTLARRLDEIEEASIKTVAVFHSSAEEMLKYQGRLPFACVADPGLALYRQFGVERGLKALFHPRVLLNGARWVLGQRRFYRRAENGILGLPAEFLIDSQGVIRAAKYGEHADDHWSVDELLANAAQIAGPGAG